MSSEFGGAYRQGPQYHQGFLGVDWIYDPQDAVYRIGAIVQGDLSDEHTAAPLAAVDVDVVGTDPDIEVEITLQDDAAGRDPQLERAIAEALRLLAEHPPHTPQPPPRPRLTPRPRPTRYLRG